MSMSKNICIFSSHYFPYLGGVENYTYNLARKLMQNGDKVVIVTSNDAHLSAYEKMDGIPVFRLPCYNLLGGRFPVSKVNGEYKQLYKKLMGFHFDLVIVQTRMYPHSVAGMRFAKRQGCKCITIDHGTSHMTVDSKFWDTLGSWYEHLITAYEKRLCKNYYGVSQDSLEWLKHFGIKPAGVLYNAIDYDKIQALISLKGRNFRGEYKIPDDTIIITYTGRLVKEKGIMNLIAAVKQYTGQQKICLMIAGDGEEMASVKANERDDIIALGRLDFDDIIALLKQSQIFCLPTDYPEGFPTSTLEAVACDCYIITTTRGGSRELLIDDGYGIIMKDNRPPTIVDAITKSMTLGKGRQTAIKKTKDHLIKHFTWDIIAEKVHELIVILSEAKNLNGEFINEETDNHSSI